MKRQSVLILTAVAGFAVSLLALGQQVHAQENPLLDSDFWKAATVEEVATAISAGADVNAQGRRGITPLHYAAHFGNPEVVRALLGRGADVNAQAASSTPLHFAAEYNDNPGMVRALIDNGADVNAQTALGFTPLHLAAVGQSNPEVVRALLNNGADVSARTRSGDTPLDLAKHNDNPEVAGALRGGGADVNARTRSGDTRRDVAKRSDNPGTAPVLRGGGADVNARTRSGDTRRDVAERSDISEVLGLVLDLTGSLAPENPLLQEEFWKTASVQDVITAIREGADLHARDSEFGGTPLHWAAWWHRNPEVARQLIVRGADLHAKDDEFGDTPLHWAAAFNSNPDFADLLLDRGADIHERNKSGWTPLHQAAALNENPDIVSLLLDRGADAAARDKFGKTPFDLAQDNEHLKNSNVYWRLDEMQYANARAAPRASRQQARARNCPYSRQPSHRGGCALLNYAFEGYDSFGLRAWQAEDMIAAGANVNAIELSPRGHILDSPLHIFSAVWNVEVVAVMLEHGADANLSTWKGETPLHTTLLLPGHAGLSDEEFDYIANAMYEIVVMLLRAGAEVNVRDEDGNTPLLMAYELGYEPIYSILKRYGAR